MKITKDVLESYLKCKYKGYLKLAGALGTKSDYELLLLDSRNQVRLAAMDKLLVRRRESEVRQGCSITITMLKQAVPLLLDTTLENNEFSICFDALQKETGPSSLGDFHYAPVLFHEAERPDRNQTKLLELYGLILCTLQGCLPDSGILMHGQGCNKKKVRLNLNSQVPQRTMQEIREIQGIGKLPRLILNSHCQICEFHHLCQAEATEKDDLSLLRGMGEKEIRKYNRRGIFTVTQLSCTFRPRKRSKRVPQKTQPHQAALQALAIRDNKIYIQGTPELPFCSTRIYFDMEGDLDRHFNYLLGMIIERNGKEERHSFWVNTQAEEDQLFQHFLDIVTPLDDYCLYSYGNYELAFLRRMIKESSQQELSQIILPRWVNVLSIIYTHVYFPTYSNSLKDIGRYLGFQWTQAEASGIQSLVWRNKWEVTGSPVFKEILTTYNMEDCAALRKVTECLYAICAHQPSIDQSQALIYEDYHVSWVEEIEPQWSHREWCPAEFAVPDFKFVNERAYFDYQRDRVFIRTSKTLKKRIVRAHNRKGKKNLRPNRSVHIAVQECPFCNGTDMTRKPDGRLARLTFDLRITQSGIKRWVSRFTTDWHWCGGCGERFLPREYLCLDEHFHSLKSWAMYEHVDHRTSFANIAEKLKEWFGLPVFTPDVHTFKRLLSRYYEETYKQLLDKIVSGAIIHADETDVHIKQTAKGYVWVFTNLEEVVFMYRPSREGSFLNDLLKDFHGVLISDFYAPYDSLQCEQQKCLIHLIRDFNNDINSNPWDEELKALASDFGRLLRKIMETVDQYGLRQRYLEIHHRDVEQFFSVVSRKLYQSDVAEGYRKRLLKYKDKLFNFLNHDGVPWNNNNAEHAVKRFAYYREMVDGLFSETGLKEYLVLLSISVTCRYKEVSFLQFLLSQEKDIDTFCQSINRKRALPTIELCPEGFTFSRRKRRPDWDQRHKRDTPMEE